MKLFTAYCSKTIQCRCGKRHSFGTGEILLGSGVLKKLPEMMARSGFSGKGLVIGDEHTFAAAGETVCRILGMVPRPFERLTLFPRPGAPKIAVETGTLRSVRMRMRGGVSWAIAVGGGTVNDLVKIASSRAGIPYVLVLTSPAADGALSPVASCLRNNMREPRPNLNVPIGVIADTGIISQAPGELFAAGIGEAAAKMISLLDWQLNHILCGEEYCERTAKLLKTSLNNVLDCVLAADRENLLTALLKMHFASSLAMQAMGNSHPAAGGEHWVSHAIVMECCFKRGEIPTLHGAETAAGVSAALNHLKKIFSSRSRKTLHFRSGGEYADMLAQWNTAGLDFSGTYGRKSKRMGKAAMHLAELDGNPSFGRAVDNVLEFAGIWRKIAAKYHLPVSVKALGFRSEEADFILQNSPVLSDRISIFDLVRK